MRMRRIIVAAVIVGAASAAVVYLRRDPPPSAAEQALGRVLPDVRFDATPFDQAVATLAREAGSDIYIDRPALEAGGIDPAKRVDLRLRHLSLDRVLTHLLGYVSSTTSDPLIHTVFQGRIVITSAGNAGAYAYARVYDVRDVVVELPEDVGPPRDIRGCFGSWHDDGLPMTRQEQDETLLMTIGDVTGPDVWAAGADPSNAAHALHGRLLIVTSWRGHRAVERLLAQLRDPRAIEGRRP